MADLFISHSSTGAANARRIRAAQMRRGISCWMAPDDVGSGDYAAELNREISECRAVAVILTPAAAASDHVRRELALAASLKKRIVPVRFDDYQPEGAIAYFVSGEHIIDCGGDRFETGMDDLAAAVRGAARRLPRPAPRILLELLCATVAVVLAFVPAVPVAAALRLVLTAAALAVLASRVLARMRSRGWMARSAALLVLWMVGGWLLDHATLLTVVRRGPFDPGVVLYAPYATLHNVVVKTRPNLSCEPPQATNWQDNTYDPEGPTRAAALLTFTHPDQITVRCLTPVGEHNVQLESSTSSFEIWNDRTVSWLRLAYILMGGLAWLGASSFFWLRRSSR